MRLAADDGELEELIEVDDRQRSAVVVVEIARRSRQELARLVGAMLAWWKARKKWIRHRCASNEEGT